MIGFKMPENIYFGIKEKSKFSAIASWILVIAWMIVIFVLSADDGESSASKSNQLLSIIIENFGFLFTGVFPDKAYVLRKFAHFFEFLILGMLAMNAFSGVRVLKQYRNIMACIGFCVLYAISDELHQIFVPGRAARVIDVLIDTAGATLGMLLFVLARFIRLCMRKRRDA
jgi:VanZ family protein